MNALLILTLAVAGIVSDINSARITFVAEVQTPEPNLRDLDTLRAEMFTYNTLLYKAPDKFLLKIEDLRDLNALSAFSGKRRETFDNSRVMLWRDGGLIYNSPGFTYWKETKRAPYGDAAIRPFTRVTRLPLNCTGSNFKQVGDINYPFLQVTQLFDANGLPFGTRTITVESAEFNIDIPDSAFVFIAPKEGRYIIDDKTLEWVKENQVLQ